MSFFNRFHELADKYEMLVGLDDMKVEAAKGQSYMLASKLSPKENDATWFYFADDDLYLESRRKADGTFSLECGVVCDAPNPNRLTASQNPLVKRILELMAYNLKEVEINVASIDEVLGLFEEQLKYKK